MAFRRDAILEMKTNKTLYLYLVLPIHTMGRKFGKVHKSNRVFHRFIPLFLFDRGRNLSFCLLFFDETYLGKGFYILSDIFDISFCNACKLIY